MSSTTTDFDELMQRVRSGCQEAAREVFDRYNDQVRRIVRRYLDHRLRKLYDSMDFAQSVWASFFHTPAERYNFPTPQALVRFLARVASNKVIETNRKRMQTARHGLRREDSLEAPLGGELKLGEVVPGPDHTPSQYVIADEQWEYLLRGLPDGHRRILEMVRKGYTYVEIAGALNEHPKKIQRLIQYLWNKVQRQ
jgi:RNA polymerase sigma factor (sigma-70 family)